MLFYHNYIATKITTFKYIAKIFFAFIATFIIYLLFDTTTFYRDNSISQDLLYIKDDKVSRVYFFKKLLDIQQNTKLLFWLGILVFLVIYVFVKKYGIKSKYKKS